MNVEFCFAHQLIAYSLVVFSDSYARLYLMLHFSQASLEDTWLSEQKAQHKDCFYFFTDNIEIYDFILFQVCSKVILVIQILCIDCF